MGYSIHFSAENEPDGKRKVLRLQLGKKHKDLERVIKNTSSEDLRRIITFTNYQHLKNEASNQRISLNALAIKLIREQISNQECRLFDGLEGTYRGNTSDFFHHLFPYLEAFSPKFVSGIHTTYAPNAKTLLDPFGGLGTAPFQFCMEGNKAYYCEINPLMQHIAQLKSNLRRTSKEHREKQIPQIEELTYNLEKNIGDYFPDEDLRNSYHKCFSKSEFFTKRTFDQVLRIRSILDKIYCQNDFLAICLELSIIASLIPASNMQRAGDLRRKRTKERKKYSENLIHHIIVQLEYFKRGLLTFDVDNNQPLLLTDDARTLESIPSINADLIITSPPYLNGTNYFRNTKIELWFIRVLKTKADLGKLRDKAIASGICDVRGVRSTSNPDTKFNSLEESLVDLDECAYDRRIPQMIRWYGYELSISLDGSIKHLKNNGVIAVDIGDSIYCNVKVPTDLLVKEILENNNCKIIDTLTVRKRKSRGGQEVKQVCFIAKKVTENRPLRTIKNTELFRNKWESFKNNLPHMHKPFSSRNWGHPNHSLCSYQGKLKPSIAKFLVDTFVPDAGKILDPFSGVGTIPFEAALSGKKSYGFDINPSAVAISKAKVNKPDVKRVMSTIVKLDNFIKENKNQVNTKVWLPSFNKALKDYYHPETLKEILCAREWLLKHRPWDTTISLIVSSVMHVLHGNRPYALSRRSHPVTPFAPTGEFEYKSLIEKTIQKVEKSLFESLPENFQVGDIFFQDATDTWPQEINDLDAIITSPPFFDSTRFYLANWIRLWFSGWDQKDFIHEQKRFVDEKQKKSFKCYEPIIRQSKERMKQDGVLVFHLGKSKKCNMAEKIFELSKPWFEKYEIFNESVSHCESHGISDKGTVTEHQYLLLY